MTRAGREAAVFPRLRRGADGSHTKLAVRTPEWVTDAVFYQIFPDRFARSDRISRIGLNLEGWDSAPTTFGFKGGDLYGVIEHLDYLQDLGVNAIYLNPVFSSASNHRYHTYDYFNVDPLLGGNQSLRELLDDAHRRGMRVVLDGVFNHASRGFWQFHHTLENRAASPYKDWFHFDEDRLAGRRSWGAYPSPEEESRIHDEGSLKAIGYKGWWDMPALPKFNTSTPAVRDFLFAAARHWTEFGIDGWRLDVPAEIDDDSFWQEFRHIVRSVNAEAYIVGEIWHDASRWLQGDQFDACTNYRLTAACLGFFTGGHLDLEEVLHVGAFHGQVGPLDAEAFSRRIDELLTRYPPEATRMLLNPLDSHDMPRFITCASGDVASLSLALVFLFTYPGAPCLYYGDEVGMAGRHDPDSRRAFDWSGSTWNRDILELTKRLTALRHRRRELRWGTFRALHAEEGVYAFERQMDEQRSITILNTATERREIRLGGSPSSLQDAPFSLIFGSAERSGENSPSIIVPARSAAVFATSA